MSNTTVEYRASRTLTRFHQSAALVRGIRGPVGSGKSTGCCWDLWSRAHQQAAGPSGKRKTRFAVVRNTYPELRDTTLRTWLDWFSEERVGKFDNQTMTHRINKGDVEAEVLFRALDTHDDVKKVLSLELTGVWVNEARELPKSIIDALIDRLGRYPAVKDGGCTWRGMIMDTNSPDSDHWWYGLAEEERPAGWEFFAQPPGVIETGGKWVTNPEAENLENLEPGYYETRVPGKKRDHVLIYYANRYGFVADGKPVYPDYRDDVHATKDELKPIAGRKIFIGIDFGRDPAAVLGQKTTMGQWRWIDELVLENADATLLAEELGRKLRGEYAGFEFEIYGDPAGEQRAQTDSTTPFTILRGKGINALPAPSQDPSIRESAVSSALRRMVDGQPGLLISPKCKVTRKGMAGGYCFRRVQVSGGDRFHDKPEKNRFSHPCEAAQYMMVGAGEGDAVLGVSKDWGKPLRYEPVIDTPGALAKHLRQRERALSDYS